MFRRLLRCLSAFAPTSRPSIPIEGFCVESLERRDMLAGDVMVDLSAGLLSLDGDAAANRLTIVSDGVEITVTGRGTRLNGANNPLTFSGGRCRGHPDRDGSRK